MHHSEDTTMTPEQWKMFGALAALGSIIGLARELANDTPVIRWRIALARAVLTGGLAMGAGAFEVLIEPDISPVAVLGIGALLASLGADGIIALLGKFSRRDHE